MKYLLCLVLVCSVCSFGFAQKVRYQKGYQKSNGTYVQPHYKTKSNKTNWDNYSTKPNTNSYTGQKGSKAKDYSPDAYNYGKQKPIYKGPKGGNYYYNDKQKKTYVPKRY